MSELMTLHPNVKWRLFVGFVTTTATMVVSPYLVIFFVGKIGSVSTGILYMLTILSAMVGSAVGGHLSETWGRKRVMTLSEAMMGVTMFAIASVNSPWLDLPYLTAGLFVLNMFFNGSFQPATMTLILDCSTPTSREMIFRVNYWANNLAIAIGSLIGGYVFIPHHFATFLVVGTMAFGSVAVTAFVLTDTPEGSRRPPRPTSRAPGLARIFRVYVYALRDKAFAFFLVGSVAIAAIQNQLTNYIGVHLTTRLSHTARLSMSLIHARVSGAQLLGLLKSENTLLVVVFALVVVRLMKRMNERMKIFLGTALFTLGFFLLTFSLDPGVLLLAMLVATLGELVYTPVLQSVLGHIAPEDARGIYMALYQVAAYASEIIAGAFIILGRFLTPFAVGLCILTLGILASGFFGMTLRLKGPPIDDTLQKVTHA